MRWVVLTDDHPPQLGGVATWTGWAVQALRQRHEVEVYARARTGLAVSVRPVAGRSFGRWGPLYLPWAARRALAAADAVLCTTLPLARWVRPFAPGAAIHAVGHGADVVTMVRCPQVDQLWTVSRYLADRLDGARVLPVPLPRGRRAEGDRWLFVGRALPEKGGDRFVRLVAAAGVEADLVGEGPALEAWRRLARSLDARVVFHGARDRGQVASLRERCSHAFLLSRPRRDGLGAEGLGLTLLEGRADGLVAVGCRTGGIAEAVGPGVVLEDPDDPVASLEHLAAHRAVGDPVHDTHSPGRFLEALCG